jgi:hypothetical protein
VELVWIRRKTASSTNIGLTSGTIYRDDGADQHWKGRFQQEMTMLLSPRKCRRRRIRISSW